MGQRAVAVHADDEATGWDGLDFLDARVQPNRCTSLLGLIQKHIDNLLGAIVTEQLPKRFFVIGDAVTCNLTDEIPVAVALQG